MRKVTKSHDAWAFWRHSQTAINDLSDVMQQLATAVAQDDPTLQLPPHVVRQAKRALARFQENFTLLVREQKRKAAR
jgi:ABC-type branched-subunit amino acid transport system ATPase component